MSATFGAFIDLVNEIPTPRVPLSASQISYAMDAATEVILIGGCLLSLCSLRATSPARLWVSVSSSRADTSCRWSKGPAVGSSKIERVVVSAGLRFAQVDSLSSLKHDAPSIPRIHRVPAGLVPAFCGFIRSCVDPRNREEPCCRRCLSTPSVLPSSPKGFHFLADCRCHNSRKGTVPIDRHNRCFIRSAAAF